MVQFINDFLKKSNKLGFLFVSVIGSFYLCVVSCRYNCLRIRVSSRVTWPLR